MTDNNFEEDYEEYLKLRFDGQTATTGIPLCECFCLSGEDVLDFAKKNKSLTYEQLVEQLKFGTGCGQCALSMKSWLNKTL